MQQAKSTGGARVLRDALAASLREFGQEIPRGLSIRLQDGAAEIRRGAVDGADARVAGVVHEPIDGSGSPTADFLATATRLAMNMIRRDMRAASLTARGIDHDAPPRRTCETHPLTALTLELHDQQRMGMEGAIEQVDGLLLARGLVAVMPGGGWSIDTPGRTTATLLGSYASSLAGYAGPLRDLVTMPTSGDAAIDGAVTALTVHSARIVVTGLELLLEPCDVVPAHGGAREGWMDFGDVPTL